jgi:hypothetical protein
LNTTYALLTPTCTSDNLGGNFSDIATAPFRRDVTCGYTEIERDGIIFSYIVMPIEYCDLEDPGNVEKNSWVIGLMPLYNPYLPGFVGFEADNMSIVNAWKDDIRITPLVPNAILPFTNYEDPMVSESFARYEDVSERIARFMGGERGALNEPGLFLMVDVPAGIDDWLR